MTERPTDEAGGGRPGTDATEDRERARGDALERLSALLAETPDDLRVAADAAVRDADGTEDLLADLEDLLASREAAASADATEADLGEADSVADLRAALDERVPADRVDLPNVEVDVDAGTATEHAARTADRARTAGSDAVDRLRTGVGGLRDRVVDTRETDDGGEEAIGVGVDGADATGVGDSATTDGDGPDAVDDEAGGDAPPEATDRSPTADADPLPVPDPAGTRRSLARVRARAGQGAADLKYTVKNADPKQAALWGLATGATLANPAIAAGYSTAVLLSGAVLGGTAVGAYASTHEGTVLDDLDPLEMARNANGMAAANAHRSNLNGRALGSVLGATAYVAGRVTPEEYAHWLADVDLDTVARGADLGAGAARDRDDLDLRSPASGALLGGGLGAAYGLATEGGDDDAALRELLDTDLYDDYRRALDGDAGGDGDEA